MTLIMPGWYL